MMFASPPMHQQQFQFSPQSTTPSTSPATSHFAPARPSPLSPRRAQPLFTLNQQQQQQPHHIQAPPTFQFTPTKTTPTSSPSKHSPNSTYAQRYAQLSNPLNNTTRASSSSPSARTARRNVFLNRVKQDRDAGRFENRGEQLVLMESVAEQRKWGERMGRSAEGILGGLEEEDEEEMEVEGGGDRDDEALNDYLNQERALEMELGENGGREEGAFSDDEYEGIFMDLADQRDDMDMSG